jgi:hypothetical protein
MGIARTKNTVSNKEIANAVELLKTLAQLARRFASGADLMSVALEEVRRYRSERRETGASLDWCGFVQSVGEIDEGLQHLLKNFTVKRFTLGYLSFEVPSGFEFAQASFNTTRIKKLLEAEYGSEFKVFMRHRAD